MMVKITKSSVGKIFGLLILSNLMLFFLDTKSSYHTMGWISIAQLIINMCVAIPENRRSCFFLWGFLFCSWFFHCGQIIKLAFAIEGTVPLDVRNYGSDKAIAQAFIYYFISQMFVTMGMIFYNCSGVNQSKRVIRPFKEKKTALYFIIIGVLPRLYIDLKKLLGAALFGYSGVYSLVIPQPVQTLAFFFDAGMMIMLIFCPSRKKRAVLFYGFTAYKVLGMVSGGRQEALCFLIVWFIVYYFEIRKINSTHLIILGVVAYFAIILLDAIGEVRSSESITFQAVLNYMLASSNSTLIGDSLGEFGSALCSLVVSVVYAPSYGFGAGRTYIAGLMSAIPKVVSTIPILSKTLYFTLQSPPGISFALGGSYIGEIFYNFSWLGLPAFILVGILAGYCQKYLGQSNFRGVWSALLSICLFLFIRGYFVDHVQKMVWIWMAAALINRWHVSLGEI